MNNGHVWVRFTEAGVRHLQGELRSTVCGLPVSELTPRVFPEGNACLDCRRAVRRRIERLTALEHDTWGEH